METGKKMSFVYAWQGNKYKRRECDLNSDLILCSNNFANVFLQAKANLVVWWVLLFFCPRVKGHVVHSLENFISGVEYLFTQQLLRSSTEKLDFFFEHDEGSRIKINTKLPTNYFHMSVSDAIFVLIDFLSILYEFHVERSRTKERFRKKWEAVWTYDLSVIYGPD